MRIKNKIYTIVSIVLPVIAVIVLLLYSKGKIEEVNGEYNNNQNVEQLVINTQEKNTKGMITVYINDEVDYAYYGEILIVNDGYDGNEIEIIVQSNERKVIEKEPNNDM